VLNRLEYFGQSFAEAAPKQKASISVSEGVAKLDHTPLEAASDNLLKKMRVPVFYV